MWRAGSPITSTASSVPANVTASPGIPRSNWPWSSSGGPRASERYLDLARFFVEEHGNDKHRQLYGSYCQDHLPVREQTEPVGHAVRFLYFYSAVADLAAIDGDEGYATRWSGCGSTS